VSGRGWAASVWEARPAPPRWPLEGPRAASPGPRPGRGASRDGRLEPPPGAEIPGFWQPRPERGRRCRAAL